MEGMTEPILIGCPDWAKLLITSSRKSLELGALGITIPTIDNGLSQIPDRVLRLKDEVLLDRNDGIYPLQCE